MLETLATQSLAVALLMWVVLYASDYYLSLLGSRMHKQAVSQPIVYQGGIELTPQFREDVASLRLLSPRWVRALIAVGAALALLWLGAVRILQVPRLFSLAIGGVVLLEAAVHLRHLRVLMLLRRLRKGQGPTGRVEYPRWFLFDQSAVELAGFGLLYLFLFMVTSSLFILGGAVFVSALSLRHWLWGRTELARSEPAQPLIGSFDSMTAG